MECTLLSYIRAANHSQITYNYVLINLTRKKNKKQFFFYKFNKLYVLFFNSSLTFTYLYMCIFVRLIKGNLFYYLSYILFSGQSTASYFFISGGRRAVQDSDCV